MNGAKGLTERGREMRRVLAAQERSGLSLAEFARRQGLRANTLSWWRYRLRGSGAEREAVGGAQFIEVSPPGGAGRELDVVAFEIILGDGTVVRVPQRFGEESLRQILAVLRC